MHQFSFRPRLPDWSAIRFASSALASAVVIGLMSPLAGHAQSALPALVEPPSQEHHTGKVVLVELVTPDLAAAKAFYGGLFGWTFKDTALGPNARYSQAYLDDQPVAGLVELKLNPGVQRQPSWISFMSTPNVDSTAAAALNNGAKELLAPRLVAGRGKEAVFADPQGAVFGMITSQSGDPQDDLAAPGEWIWSALVAADPDRDAAFYQTLFNYDVYELPGEGPNLHLIFASDKFSRASANPLPAHVPNMHPHWLSFVRVQDAAAAARRVQALGGKVLVEPHPDRHGGRLAVVADTTGAPFGLMEWDEAETAAAGVAK
jgi:predicted enzyme related to lactoylglutathione lyase